MKHSSRTASAAAFELSIPSAGRQPMKQTGKGHALVEAVAFQYPLRVVSQ